MSRINYFLEKFSYNIENTSSQKIIIGIILLTLIIFSPIFMGSEFLTYDDDWYIYENPNVLNLSLDSIKNMFTQIQGGQYSPLGELYHSIIYFFFGKNATAFKIFALLIHLLNIILAYKLLEKLFRDRLLIITATLFFAIHPTQVETIGWLSVIYRNAVPFMLAGYLLYLKYYESGFKLIKILPVILCYILAFITKEQAILFPAGIFLINQLKSKKFINKRFIYEMVFWSILGLIFGIITIQVTKSSGPNIITHNIPLFEKISLLSKTLITYLEHFILPYNLSFSYPYPAKGVTKPYYMLLIIPLIILGILKSLKSKTIRFGFLWLLFFLSLGLSFSFLHMRESFMADRYSYFSIIGFAIIFYKVLLIIKKKTSFNKGVLPMVILGYIFIISALSFKRVSIFNNSNDLWSQALSVAPNNPFAHNSIAVFLKKTNKIDSAFYHYKRALDLAPKYYLAHSNISNIYVEKKQYKKALYHVSKAIEIQPKYYTALKNRVIIFKKLNAIDGQIKDLNKLLVIYPKNNILLQERALALFKKKKYELAKKDALRAFKIAPDDPVTNYILGHSELMLNNNKSANIFLTRAISFNSEKGNYYFYRSVARLKLNQAKKSLKDAIKAKKLGHKVNDTYIKILVDKAKKQS